MKLLTEQLEHLIDFAAREFIQMTVETHHNVCPDCSEDLVTIASTAIDNVGSINERLKQRIRFHLAVKE